ncbi:hypothetical protein P7C73_g378, partial [Tremellales sp. Uapishka_1]
MSSTPKIPSIKLKLSLGAATPATPPPWKDESVPSIRLKAPIAQPSNEAGPSSIKLKIPHLDPAPPAPHTPLPSMPASTSTSSTPQAQPQSKSKPKPKAKTKVKAKGKAKSAIPQRLYSSISTPSRSIPPSSATSTPASTPGTEVKSEPMEMSPDPLVLPLDGGGGGEDRDTPERGRAQVKWMRLKKPLRELGGKIMVELRRRDEYGLFQQPVELDDYPDYLDIIGGEDNMMDLGTMQTKLDDGRYRSMEELEADLKALVAAAQKFNPPGTIPHTSAAKMLTHGQRHIDRARDLVITPSSSPARNASASATPYRGQSVLSNPAMATPNPMLDIPPSSYIPTQMLNFPPNSLMSLAVGWNLTGGRNVRPKRFIRGREKFTGKWREWNPDGTRDIAEVDDPEHLFGQSRFNRDFRVGTDWKGLRYEGSRWWEWEGPGGSTGQPPLPGSGMPRRERLKQRKLTHLDFGIFPDVEDEQETSSRPPTLGGPPKQGGNFVNIYGDVKDAKNWLSDMCTGDTRGEAYLRSVERFVQGARPVKKDLDPETKPETDKLGLDEYVFTTWRNGLLSSGPRQLVLHTLSDLHSPAPESKYSEIARKAYSRIALKALTAASNPLDIAPLLKSPKDFLYQGIGGRKGVKEGLDWIGQEIQRTIAHRQKRKRENGEESPGSSPLSTLSEEQVEEKEREDPAVQPDKKEGGEEGDEEEGMRQLRLELVALSKYYPLAALKKMEKERAERYLPSNVKDLMSR